MILNKENFILLGKIFHTIIDIKVIIIFHSWYLKGSFDLSKVSKYGWRRAILAEILLFGSKAVIPFNKSTSNSLRVAVWFYIGIPRNFGKDYLKSGNFSASGQLFSFGVPSTLNILKI